MGSPTSPTSPVSLDEIIRYFSEIQTKQAILEGVCHFAGPYFQSVAIFAVQGQEMVFMSGHGPNIRQPRIIGRPIPINRVTIFRRCAVNNMRYQGAMPVGEEEKAVFHQIVHEIPDEFWLYPGQVGETVDCLFYAEHPLQLRELATERLEFIISKAVLAMRMLYIRKQLASKI